MFTGIIKATSVIEKPHFEKFDLHFWVDLKPLGDFKIGASIAINGVCLTVADKQGTSAKFEVMEETLAKTSFKKIQSGQIVNLEDSLQLGDRLDGHVVYGDIDATGEVKKITKIGHSQIYQISFPAQYQKFLVNKGRITIDGISLTVNNCTRHTFEVAIIPHTNKITTINSWGVGKIVNLEYDIYLKALVKQTEVKDAN